MGSDLATRNNKHVVVKVSSRNPTFVLEMIDFPAKNTPIRIER